MLEYFSNTRKFLNHRAHYERINETLLIPASVASGRREGGAKTRVGASEELREIINVVALRRVRETVNEEKRRARK